MRFETLIFAENLCKRELVSDWLRESGNSGEENRAQWSTSLQSVDVPTALVYLQVFFLLLSFK